jgi:AcrR family transcriptional regulator
MTLPTKPRRAGTGQPRPPRREGPAAPLSRERIVGAALALVDRGGPGALSMRRLGAELGVDPMAVYYHIPNKDALLDAIVEAVMAEIDLTVDHPEDPVEERIMCAARAYRDVLLAHASALPIVLARGPATPVAMRPVELLLGLLRTAGLPPAQAMAGMNAIAAAVRGVVGMIAAHQGEPPAPGHREAMLGQLPAGDFPHLREAILCADGGFERDFEFGIRALARGLMASVRDT